MARTNDTNVVAKAVPNPFPSVPNPCHPCPIRAQLLKPMIAQIAVREPTGQAILNLAGVRGSRTHPGLPRSPTTVLKTAGTTGHHPLPSRGSESRGARSSPPAHFVCNRQRRDASDGSATRARQECPRCSRRCQFRTPGRLIGTTHFGDRRLARELARALPRAAGRRVTVGIVESRTAPAATCVRRLRRLIPWAGPLRPETPAREGARRASKAAVRPRTRAAQCG